MEEKDYDGNPKRTTNINNSQRIQITTNEVDEDKEENKA